jgi:hypothetical protein
VSSVSKNASELVGDNRSREGRKDGANWTVEVEQECARVSEELSRGHRTYSRATLVHMLSNHVLACSTY